MSQPRTSPDGAISSFYVEILIEGKDALSYHGKTLDEKELARLIADTVYEHTNTHYEEIKVVVTRGV